MTGLRLLYRTGAEGGANPDVAARPSRAPSHWDKLRRLNESALSAISERTQSGAPVEDNDILTPGPRAESGLTETVAQTVFAVCTPGHARQFATFPRNRESRLLS